MKILGRIVIYFLFILVCFSSQALGAAGKNTDVKKILVVDSYHRQYHWSQETHFGFCSAMLKLGFFDNQQQVARFTGDDVISTSRAEIKKVWMDTKRKSSTSEIKEASLAIYKMAHEFGPDIIFLGDDNAANFLGNHFLDSAIPVVFWGVNNSPLKYGLVDSIEKPGHNVTGVYQSGYYADSIKFLQTIVPEVKKIAVLSVHTPTGRSHYKAVEHLAHKGNLPFELIETVATTSYEEFQSKALELQGKADAFFLAHLTGFKDELGRFIPLDEVIHWYISNINIPEACVLGHYIEGGILCGATDAGFNQGYQAALIGNDILVNGADPATYSPVTPKRGPLTVNRKRAEMLGITLNDNMGIEEYYESTAVIKD